MKLKHLVLAGLAAMAMGQAMAVTSTNTSNSTLEVLIGDQNHSYLFDTGVSLASIEAGTAHYSVTLPNWASFDFAATTPFDSVSGNGVRWALQSGTYVSGAIGTSALLISGSSTALTDGSLPTDGSVTNSIISLGAQGLKQNDIENIQPLLASGQNIAVNGDASGAFVIDPQFNVGYVANQNGQALLTGSDSLSLYLESQVGTPRTAKAATPGLITELKDVVTINTATGQLNIATVAAVPEPSTYALMLGGLAAVCFVARRRRV